MNKPNRSVNMRGFVILSFFSVTLAAPQGYNYVARQVQQKYGMTAANTAAFIKDLQTMMALQAVMNEPKQSAVPPNFGAFTGDQNSLGQSQSSTSLASQISRSSDQLLAPPPVSANSLQNAPIVYENDARQFPQQYPNQHQYQHQGSHPNHQDNSQQTPRQPLVSKRFFIHSAPEDDDENVIPKTVTIGRPRKNYNVVFIKAPAGSSQKTSLKITPATNEERTIIYVLARKDDDSDIDAQVQETPTTTAKPEVYFITYKTPEEAAHAQRSIQAQYDSLGGSTHVSNEGVAPVSSVIGTLDAVNQESGSAEADENDQAPPYAVEPGSLQSLESQPIQQTPVSQAQSSQISNNGYLPPHQ